MKRFFLFTVLSIIFIINVYSGNINRQIITTSVDSIKNLYIQDTLNHINNGYILKWDSDSCKLIWTVDSASDVPSWIDSSSYSNVSESSLTIDTTLNSLITYINNHTLKVNVDTSGSETLVLLESPIVIKEGDGVYLNVANDSTIEIISVVGSSISDAEVDNNITITGISDSSHWRIAYDSVISWGNVDVRLINIEADTQFNRIAYDSVISWGNVDVRLINVEADTQFNRIAYDSVISWGNVDVRLINVEADTQSNRIAYDSVISWGNGYFLQSVYFNDSLANHIEIGRYIDSTTNDTIENAHNVNKIAGKFISRATPLDNYILKYDYALDSFMLEADAGGGAIKADTGAQVWDLPIVTILQAGTNITFNKIGSDTLRITASGSGSSFSWTDSAGEPPFHVDSSNYAFKAAKADSATKASSDGVGNSIVSTYATILNMEKIGDDTSSWKNVASLFDTNYEKLTVAGQILQHDTSIASEGEVSDSLNGYTLIASSYFVESDGDTVTGSNKAWNWQGGKLQNIDIVEADSVITSCMVLGSDSLVSIAGTGLIVSENSIHSVLGINISDDEVDDDITINSSKNSDTLGHHLYVVGDTLKSVTNTLILQGTGGITQFQSDTNIFGSPSSSNNIVIQMKHASVLGGFRYNMSTSKIQFSNNGTDWTDIGSAGGTSDTTIFVSDAGIPFSTISNKVINRYTKGLIAVGGDSSGADTFNVLIDSSYLDSVIDTSGVLFSDSTAGAERAEYSKISIDSYTRERLLLDLGMHSSPNADTWLILPAVYDGINAGVHPDVIYVEEGWPRRKYIGDTLIYSHKYWMVAEPFDSSAGDIRENPTVYASDDSGYSWYFPYKRDTLNAVNETIPIPLVQAQTSRANSDANLVIGNDDRLYIYWRQFWTSNWEKLWVKSTSNGVDWGDSALLFTILSSTNDKCVSPTVIYDDGLYKLWYIQKLTSSTTRLCYMQSAISDGFGTADTLNPDDTIHCSLSGIPSGTYVWHINIDKIGDMFVGVFTVYNFSTFRYINYIASSFNGINWIIDPLVLTNAGVSGAWDDSHIYEGCTVPIDEGNKWRLGYWYSATYTTVGYTFRIGYTTISLIPDTLYTSEGELEDSLDNYTPTSGLSISNWNTSYGWGNHASAGYLTTEVGDISSVTAGTGLNGGGTGGEITINLTSPVDSAIGSQRATTDAVGHTISTYFSPTTHEHTNVYLESNGDTVSGSNYTWDFEDGKLLDIDRIEVDTIGEIGLTTTDSMRIFNKLYFGSNGNIKLDSTHFDSIVNAKGVYGSLGVTIETGEITNYTIGKIDIDSGASFVVGRMSKGTSSTPDSDFTTFFYNKYHLAGKEILNTPPTDDQVLKYDASSGKLQFEADAGTGGGDDIAFDTSLSSNGYWNVTNPVLQGGKYIILSANGTESVTVNVDTSLATGVSPKSWARDSLVNIIITNNGLVGGGIRESNPTIQVNPGFGIDTSLNYVKVDTTDIPSMNLFATRTEAFFDTVGNSNTIIYKSDTMLLFKLISDTTLFSGNIGRFLYLNKENNLVLIDSARIVKNILFGKSGIIKLDSVMVDSIINAKGRFEVATGDISAIYARGGLTGDAISGDVEIKLGIGFGLDTTADLAYVDTTNDVASKNLVATKVASSITISTGSGLTGGGDLTTNRTISVGTGANGINETMVNWGSSTNQIDATDIQETVTRKWLGADKVTSAYIYDGTIINADMANDGLDPDKIIGDATDNDRLDSGVVAPIVHKAERDASGNIITTYYSPTTHNHNSSYAPITPDSTEIDSANIREWISDKIGGMVTGNTETGITVTYQDADNTLDFVVAAPSYADSAGKIDTSYAPLRTLIANNVFTDNITLIGGVKHFGEYYQMNRVFELDTLLVPWAINSNTILGIIGHVGSSGDTISDSQVIHPSEVYFPSKAGPVQGDTLRAVSDSSVGIKTLYKCDSVYANPQRWHYIIAVTPYYNGSPKYEDIVIRGSNDNTHFERLWCVGRKWGGGQDTFYVQDPIIDTAALNGGTGNYQHLADPALAVDENGDLWCAFKAAKSSGGTLLALKSHRLLTWNKSDTIRLHDCGSVSNIVSPVLIFGDTIRFYYIYAGQPQGGMYLKRALTMDTNWSEITPVLCTLQNEGVNSAVPWHIHGNIWYNQVHMFVNLCDSPTYGGAGNYGTYFYTSAPNSDTRFINMGKFLDQNNSKGTTWSMDSTKTYVGTGIPYFDGTGRFIYDYIYSAQRASGGVEKWYTGRTKIYFTPIEYVPIDNWMARGVIEDLIVLTLNFSQGDTLNFAWVDSSMGSSEYDTVRGYWTNDVPRYYDSLIIEDYYQGGADADSKIDSIGIKMPKTSSRRPDSLIYGNDTDMVASTLTRRAVYLKHALDNLPSGKSGQISFQIYHPDLGDFVKVGKVYFVTHRKY